jgi:hypothetical protein
METEIQAQVASRYYYWQWQRFIVCSDEVLRIGVWLIFEDVYPTAYCACPATMAANFRQDATSDREPYQCGVDV